ncbi:hypothetical protein [Duganella vulcania]|uniref:Uncharacterized protein n=1 Tax=Duganella vulcania TaxID=2692166 RepID=A0A845GRE7_9BURK|nr:hypothetical protein [Duganella vulcania]MYM95826.1 hypothetical protein [Duganella vulcania]
MRKPGAWLTTYQLAQEFQQLCDASPSDVVRLFALVGAAFAEEFFGAFTAPISEAVFV